MISVDTPISPNLPNIPENEMMVTPHLAGISMQEFNSEEYFRNVGMRTLLRAIDIEQGDFDVSSRDDKPKTFAALTNVESVKEKDVVCPRCQYRGIVPSGSHSVEVGSNPNMAPEGKGSNGPECRRSPVVELPVESPSNDLYNDIDKVLDNFLSP